MGCGFIKQAGEPTNVEHVHVGELTKNNGGDMFSYTDTSKGQRMTNEHSGDKAEGNVDLDRDR